MQNFCPEFDLKNLFSRKPKNLCPEFDLKSQYFRQLTKKNAFLISGKWGLCSPTFSSPTPRWRRPTCCSGCWLTVFSRNPSNISSILCSISLSGNFSADFSPRMQAQMTIAVDEQTASQGTNSTRPPKSTCRRKSTLIQTD